MPEPKIKLPFNLPQLNFEMRKPEKSKLRLYILSGVLFALILVAIGTNYYFKKQQASDLLVNLPDLNGKQIKEDLVQILPQLQRNEDPDSVSQLDYFKNISDPFSTPVELLGIITGEQDLVIIKAQQVSYILALGDKIADAWELTQINRSSVTLKNDTKEIIVELSPRK